MIFGVAPFIADMVFGVVHACQAEKVRVMQKRSILFFNHSHHRHAQDAVLIKRPIYVTCISLN